MKRNSIILVSIGVFLIVLIDLLSTFFEFQNKLLSFCITIGPVILFYIQFMINNQNKAFIYWNKLKVKWNNPGLKWQLTSYLEYKDVEIEKMSNFYDVLLKDKNYEYYSDDTPKIISKKNSTLIIEIGITQYTVMVKSDELIKVSSSSSINYRDSKEKLNKDFKYILELISKTVEKPTISEEYVLKISFKKENPYYGILLKSLEKDCISSFILKYRQDGLDFTVSRNTIETRTTSFDEISKVSENYLVLSDN